MSSYQEGLEEKERRLYTAAEIGEPLGVDLITIGKIASMVNFVLVPETKRVDVGLGLKATAFWVYNPDFVTPEYSRVRVRWRYKENAQEVLRDYVKEFPHVVGAIEGTLTLNIYPENTGTPEEEVLRCHEYARKFRRAHPTRIFLPTETKFTVGEDEKMIEALKRIGFFPTLNIK